MAHFLPSRLACTARPLPGTPAASSIQRWRLFGAARTVSLPRGVESRISPRCQCRQSSRSPIMPHDPRASGAEGIMSDASPIRNPSDPDPTSPAPAVDAATASPQRAGPQESHTALTEGVSRQPSSPPIRYSTPSVPSSAAPTIARGLGSTRGTGSSPRRVPVPELREDPAGERAQT